jgi:enamine deaminase RidA (YjgF/YER057c/UK114 family)
MNTNVNLALSLLFCIAFGSFLCSTPPISAQEKAAASAQKPLIRFFNPPMLSQPTRYNHVAEVRSDARFVFFSGQVSQDASGAPVGKGDIRAQTRQVFMNVQAALQAIGGDWSNVVKITSFVVGSENIDAFREVRQEMLKSVNPLPASTAVVVQKLFGEDWLVEVEIIAAFPTTPQKQATAKSVRTK